MGEVLGNRQQATGDKHEAEAWDSRTQVGDRSEGIGRDEMYITSGRGLTETGGRSINLAMELPSSLVNR